MQKLFQTLTICLLVSTGALHAMENEGKGKKPKELEALKALTQSMKTTNNNDELYKTLHKFKDVFASLGNRKSYKLAETCGLEKSHLLLDLNQMALFSQFFDVHALRENYTSCYNKKRLQNEGTKVQTKLTKYLHQFSELSLKEQFNQDKKLQADLTKCIYQFLDFPLETQLNLGEELQAELHDLYGCRVNQNEQFSRFEEVQHALKQLYDLWASKQMDTHSNTFAPFVTRGGANMTSVDPNDHLDNSEYCRSVHYKHSIYMSEL